MESSSMIVAATDLHQVLRRRARPPCTRSTASRSSFTRGQFTRDHGPVGVRQVDADALPRRPRPPDVGLGEIDGAEITTLDDKHLTDLRREKIGFIFQAFNLLPVLTAEENVTLPLTIAGRDVDEAWVDTLIDRIGLSDRRTHRPSELSGGQQQRVAIARALVTRPAVVFADEPTGNLDSKSSAEVLELLRDAVDEFGQTVVMVTHDADAAAVGDRLRRAARRAHLPRRTRPATASRYTN